MSPPKKELLEKHAMDLILKAGKNGILQTELWKRLGVSSREGSRISIRLANWGMITRKKVLHKGRWTFLLVAKRHPPTLQSILGAPCIICEYSDKCTPGGSPSPELCEKLERWIVTSYVGGVKSEEEMDREEET